MTGIGCWTREVMFVSTENHIINVVLVGVMGLIVPFFRNGNANSL